MLYIPGLKLQLSTKTDPRVHDYLIQVSEAEIHPKDLAFMRSRLLNTLMLSH